MLDRPDLLVLEDVDLFGQALHVVEENRIAGCGYVYLVGQASDVPVTSTAIESGSETDKSWNLVANPSVEPKGVTEMRGDNYGDQIIVPTDGAPKNYVYNSEKGEWGYYDTATYTTSKGKTRVRTIWVSAADDEIPAGTGFWYLNSSEKGSIDW